MRTRYDVLGGFETALWPLMIVAGRVFVKGDDRMAEKMAEFSRLYMVQVTSISIKLLNPIADRAREGHGCATLFCFAG